MSTINDNHYLKDAGYSNYFNNKDLARHRWYYYKEGFSPLLVEDAIEQVGLTNRELIIDPFNGSGTTTLTASIKGYKSIGIEVNPFTAFLSEAKLKSSSAADIDKWSYYVTSSAQKSFKSELIGYSTFSEQESLEKWLFNDSVLNAFEACWIASCQIPSYNLRKLIKIALITSAMKNCNATRDGKCLRYRKLWKNYKFDKDSFLQSFNDNIDIIKTDIELLPLLGKASIISGDARKVLHKDESIDKFKLCITSPPYLNTFDYTDIYRPELFLGKFIKNNQQLYNLRLNTVRSHIQASWDLPTRNDFGILYEQSIKHLKTNEHHLMDKKIPMMVQAYFEDMLNILKLLKNKAEKGAQLWLVVSNSAYADQELPVDLIIGDLGSKAGWFLKEIVVLRYIKKRKTIHSPNVDQLRESVVIFSSDKRQ